MIHLWRPLSRLYWVMQTAALFYFDGKRKKVRVRGILEKHETPTSQFLLPQGPKLLGTVIFSENSQICILLFQRPA